MATSGVGCAPNGRIAASVDGTGKVFGCQNGTWTALGETAKTSLATAYGLNGSTWPDILRCQTNQSNYETMFMTWWGPFTTSVKYMSADGYYVIFDAATGAYSSISGGMGMDCVGRSVQALAATGQAYWMNGKAAP